MPEQFQPLFDRVLVKELNPPELRKSGLAIPDSAIQRRRPPQEGIVLAAGKGQDWWEHVGMEMPVAAGDHVIFPWQAGTYIEVDEEELLVLRVGELLGVMVRE